MATSNAATEPDDLVSIPDDLKPVSSETRSLASQSEEPDDLVPSDKITTNDIRSHVNAEVGAAKEVWAGLKGAAGSASDAVQNFAISNLPSGGSEALSTGLHAAGSVAKGALDFVGGAVNVADRVAGTAFSAGTDAFNYLDPVADVIDKQLNENHVSLMQAAQARQAISGEDKSLFNRVFPVRLIEDIGTPTTVRAVTGAGQYLQTSDDPETKEAGKLLQYVAPAAGIVGGIALFEGLPGSFATFGELTDAGVAAEKAKALAPTIAEQVAQGQKNLAKFSVGPYDIGSTNFGTVGKAATQAVSKLSVAFDASTVGKAVSKISTDTFFPEFNQARDEYSMQKNQLQAQTKQFFRNMGSKADALGIDTEDPEVLSTLTKGLDNPAKLNGVVDADKVENFYSYANGELQTAVKNSRMNGIEVPIKDFSAAEDGTASERYVPRFASPDKLSEFRTAKTVFEATKGAQLGQLESILGDASLAETMAQDLGAKSGGSSMGNFLKERNPMNTESMNAAVESKLGVKDFFSTDPIQAYGEKIHDINNTVIEKNFVQRVRDQFATSDAELIQKKMMAQQRASQALAEGRVVSPVDLRMSGLKSEEMMGYANMPANVRAKLDNLARIAPDTLGDIKGLQVPQSVGQQLIENLAPQRLQGIQAGAVMTQNLFKAFLTTNPGFYIRNWFQSATMAGAAGVGIADNVKAFAGMIMDSGEWAARDEEFQGMKRGYGAFGGIDDGLSSVGQLRQVAKVEATIEDLAGDNPYKRLMYQFRQMAGTNAWKSWLSDLKAGGIDAIRENPAFKVAASIGEGGSEIPQFAFYNKLRDAGYEPEIAMQKVKDQFLNFDNTRLATKQLSMFTPFVNHAIKNAEVTMRILAQSPRMAMTWGRDGAFQRAVENWAGWDPEQAQKTRQIFGKGWTNDQIYLGVMPDKSMQGLEQNQDLLKTIMYKVYGDAPAGAQLQLSLPSNLHALTMLDPTKLDEMSGPLVKAGIALLGTDPFTGKPLQSTDTYNGWVNRLQTAGAQFLDPMIPRTTLNAARGIMDKLHVEWSANAARLGMSPEAASVFFPTPEAQANVNKMQKAMVKVSTLWRGSYTQLDQDMGFRIMGKMKAMQDAQKSADYSFKAGKLGQSAINDFNSGYAKDTAEVLNWINIKDDYENMLKKTQAPGWQIVPIDEESK